MKIRKLPKEFRPLLKAALAQGAQAINRKDGVLLRLPNGETVMFHTSPRPGDRKFKRFELRKKGIDC